MLKPGERNIAELLTAYSNYLLSKVSKVRILGEVEERELKDVFVELSIVDQRATHQHAEFLGMIDAAMRHRFNPFRTQILDTSQGILGQRETEATIKNPRHAEYWQSHAYPVMLVIRGSGGMIRWMNVTEHLQRHVTTLTQIEFQGEPFVTESVKQMCTRLSS